MQPAKNLPEAAFFSAEEKVQLLSGNCPRNVTKERLKEWLSFRKGTAKDGSARSEATKAELSQRQKDSERLHCFLSLIIIYYCLCLSGILKHKFYIDLFYLPQDHQFFKNSWENNFTEKWKDLAASNQSKPVEQTATVNCDFPESAQWVSLVDAKDDVPTFNIQISVFNTVFSIDRFGD